MIEIEVYSVVAIYALKKIEVDIFLAEAFQSHFRGVDFPDEAGVELIKGRERRLNRFHRLLFPELRFLFNDIFGEGSRRGVRFAFVLMLRGPMSTCFAVSSLFPRGGVILNAGTVGNDTFTSLPAHNRYDHVFLLAMCL